MQEQEAIKYLIPLTICRKVETGASQLITRKINGGRN